MLIAHNPPYNAQICAHLRCGGVTIIQVCATAATVKSYHGCLESVVLYLRVSMF